MFQHFHVLKKAFTSFFKGIANFAVPLYRVFAVFGRQSLPG
jgi:hypothetical protein